MCDRVQCAGMCAQNFRHSALGMAVLLRDTCKHKQLARVTHTGPVCDNMAEPVGSWNCLHAGAAATILLVSSTDHHIFYVHTPCTHIKGSSTSNLCRPSPPPRPWGHNGVKASQPEGVT